MLAVLRNRVSEVNAAVVVSLFVWRIQKSEIFCGDFEADGFVLGLPAWLVLDGT
jgi:hypothetical protein